MTNRLMKLIDEATDPGWDIDVSGDHADPERQALVQERIASALGAIAFLLLRHDEQAWNDWESY